LPSRSGGQGLGTQIIADQVRKHHGFIEVASAQGKGAVVGILLPAPALPEDRPLEELSKRLQPYRDRSTQNPPVERANLLTLLRQDKTLSNWYRKQGEK